ncbi:tryptophanyl-tRNA synthetase [Hokovirus HKV1]|uniref:tryptophan--tRNA ligase n=1 Tax=Hokovirus HKV1 TaxID=1977638 RepID=A0A1V0SFW7_9VIRU|nr:tryptophanyl-tRNA synthetase [Hokovirus HKV1]
MEQININKIFDQNRVLNRDLNQNTNKNTNQYANKETEQEQEQEPEQEPENKINPFDPILCNKSGFDYNDIVDKFGVRVISQELLTRFELVTKQKVHPWLERGLFFAHRDLELILNDFEQGKEIFLFTGRGPTTHSLHLGHMIPFMFTKWLQDVFNAIVVIQMADDEKYYFKDLSFEQIYELQFENAKDIIACGFNKERTFIFSNYDYCTTQAPKKINT